MSDNKAVAARVRRFAEKYDVVPPDNNREVALMLGGIEIGRLQMRKAIMHSMLVDEGDTAAALHKMDYEGQW